MSINIIYVEDPLKGTTMQYVRDTLEFCATTTTVGLEKGFICDDGFITHSSNVDNKFEVLNLAEPELYAVEIPTTPTGPIEITVKKYVKFNLAFNSTFTLYTTDDENIFAEIKDTEIPLSVYKFIEFIKNKVYNLKYKTEPFWDHTLITDNNKRIYLNQYVFDRMEEHETEKEKKDNQLNLNMLKKKFAQINDVVDELMLLANCSDEAKDLASSIGDTLNAILSLIGSTDEEKENEECDT